uniref:Bardet-Biedl syndrome 1 N-terminal domain-containing protein n=1 Tax=Timema shepardi TaxID=629360 RepID=A0A7R9G5W5_TIMSH|nr:unnamed protein product [Timema shepardi]
MVRILSGPTLWFKAQTQSPYPGLNHQRWLDAFSEPHASIYTFGCCMALKDLNADGDYKLIIADLGTGATGIKLKVSTTPWHRSYWC